MCSYEGHGGLCSIRLSEPLLKFRPRKDLIETLLVGVGCKDYDCSTLYNNTLVLSLSFLYQIFGYFSCSVTLF